VLDGILIHAYLLPFSVKYVHVIGFQVLMSGVMKIQDTSLLRINAMLSGKQLTHNFKDLLRILDSEAEGTEIILMSVTTCIYQCTWCNIPEHLCILYRRFL
jgi:hypothetical protein